jgi:hypothetical protein
MTLRRATEKHPFACSLTQPQPLFNRGVPGSDLQPRLCPSLRAPATAHHCLPQFTPASSARLRRKSHTFRRARGFALPGDAEISIPSPGTRCVDRGVGAGSPCRPRLE